MKFYRGSAAAARAYLESDHSRADDYYLAEGTGLATRYIASPGAASSVVSRTGEMGGDTYEKWVAGYDIDTGRPKGLLRNQPNSLRFVEVTVNGPKTWSLAAALHPEISEALDHAQDRAAIQIIGWVAEHATTRIGPEGRQVQVPVEQIEAAVIRHYTSRAGDPHRHLHLQINARVFAEAKWRGLHSVGFRDQLTAINGIGHAAVMTDPEFRAALAARGFTMDHATGELTQLAPYVGRLSSRTGQISRNVDRYEAEWRTDHPGEEPGPKLRHVWDRRAWAEARPEKPRRSVNGREPDASALAVSAAPSVPSDGAEMVAAWNRVLHDLGYRDPDQVGLPIVPAGPRIGSLDRDVAAELVVSRLGAARSAWNAADIRGGVEAWIAATGLVAEASVRIELAEDITSRALDLSVPLLDTPGVPEHVRSLTSPRVLDVEADLMTSMISRTARAAMPEPTRLAHSPEAAEGPEGLDPAQRDAVAVLAGEARLVVVEGAAGAGKTTTLAAVQDELARQGRRLVVVTPTLKAAQVAASELSSKTRAPSPARSAASLIHAYGWSWDDDGHWTHTPSARTTTPAALSRGDLLLVDEAGMLDQDTARALFAVADQSGARVALVGDRHQLPAVGRGGVLDHAARWASPEAVVDLDVIHRFTDPEYAAISLAMRTGQRVENHAGEATGERTGDARGEHGEGGGEVFDALWDRGLIRLHASESERLHAIAVEVADAITARSREVTNPGGGVVVMADRRAEVAALNGAIRDRLVAAGHIDDTRAVATDAGERIGVGDRVATRLNDRDLGVANRETWTVTVVGPDGSLRLTRFAENRPSGQRQARDVPASYVRSQVELAYATTVYGAQGQTTSTGHMLITDTTSGSAAYVGMTRGRDHNVAHLVAADVEEARAIWDGVMGRDRADLGPAHAARLAAEEMDRYAPQRPRQVVIDQLKKAWTIQADLAGKHTRLDQLRQRIEAVLAIRAAYRPRLGEAHDLEHAASVRWGHAHDRACALEATITSEERDLTHRLTRTWQTERAEAHHAVRTIREGAGLLGLHHTRVREAREDLLAWAARWQQLLPDLTPDPRTAGDLRQGAQHVAAALGGIDNTQVRQAITGYATAAVAAAHPEHAGVLADAKAAEQAAHAAEQATVDLLNQHGREPAAYPRLGYATNLPEALQETRRDLVTLTQQLNAATDRVDRLTQSPEIRSLPTTGTTSGTGALQRVRDQWRADRTARQQAARAEARRRADLAEARAAEEAAHHRRSTPSYGRTPGRDRGPGIGF